MLVIPIVWTERTRISNFAELQSQHAQHGGQIIEYQRTWSALLVSRTWPVFEWVPPGKNRTAAGLKHAAFCAILGWWSMTGFFWNIGAILKNLSGGIDVSAVLTAPEGSPIAPEVLAALSRARKMQQLGLVAALFTLLALLTYFLVLPSLRQAGVI